MPTDPDDILARTRAARAQARALGRRQREARGRSEDLAGRLDEAQAASTVAQAEHLLLCHTPAVDARLRLLLEDGEALHRQ